MATKSRKIILFANGELVNPQGILALINDGDYLVGVDGGLNHLINLGLSPNLIIGDLDSADPGTVKNLAAQGVEVREFPADKDETDLELAISATLDQNPQAILIVAALGNRLDQTLANLFLLTRSDLSRLDIRLVDGMREVFLIQEEATISGEIGQRVSLIPLCRPAKGIQTKGLKFPLHTETLFPDQTRGISNVMSEQSAKITLQEGQLLCIHETTEPTHNVEGV
jgi:thiamine pyrophosphokinase